MRPKKREPFSKEILVIRDVPKLVSAIVDKLRHDVQVILWRRGGVVGISGGIDSSVTMVLATLALGTDKVLGIILPEKDSSHESATLAQTLADQFKVKTITENLTEVLTGFQCYNRRDEAISRVFPEFNKNTHKAKIGIKKSGIFNNLPPVFHLTIIDNQGHEKEKILPVNEYMQIVAASNFKQRSRMSMLYYHAERMHYSVLGTPNKHEVDEGFFVKYGDGGADVMPICHLYKTQVYQIARYLKIPQEIIDRTPTTDTYTAEQTQEEFFYQFPYEKLDLLWYAFENKYSPEEVGKMMGYSGKEIEQIYSNFTRKIHTTEYLRMSPIKDYKIV
jgi:NAD+ synthase